jgi:hypothetical protein
VQHKLALVEKYAQTASGPVGVNDGKQEILSLEVRQGDTDYDSDCLVLTGR